LACETFQQDDDTLKNRRYILEHASDIKKYFNLTNKYQLGLYGLRYAPRTRRCHSLQSGRYTPGKKLSHKMEIKNRHSPDLWLLRFLGGFSHGFLNGSLTTKNLRRVEGCIVVDVERIISHICACREKYKSAQKSKHYLLDIAQ
jgi:hypothetical protein